MISSLRPKLYQSDLRTLFTEVHYQPWLSCVPSSSEVFRCRGSEDLAFNQDGLLVKAQNDGLSNLCH